MSNTPKLLHTRCSSIAQTSSGECREAGGCDEDKASVPSILTIREFSFPFAFRKRDFPSPVRVTGFSFLFFSLSSQREVCSSLFFSVLLFIFIKGVTDVTPSVTDVTLGVTPVMLHVTPSVTLGVTLSCGR